MLDGFLYSEEVLAHDLSGSLLGGRGLRYAANHLYHLADTPVSIHVRSININPVPLGVDDAPSSKPGFEDLSEKIE
jgi:hypothetical protein